MAKRRTDLPEEPRVEPEIIPPMRSGSEWYSTDGYGQQRVFVSRMGPWSVFGMVLAFGIVAGAVFALVIGALLVAIPVIGLLIAGAIVFSLLRGHFARPR
jgi:hypothetical protein